MNPAPPVEPVSIRPLLRDLASPPHQTLRRDARRRLLAGKEVDLSAGYRVEVVEGRLAAAMKTCLGDFDVFMARAMKVQRRTDGYPLRIVPGAPTDCPPGAFEAFDVSCEASGLTLRAADAAGLRRGIFWLEDEMTRRQAPHLARGTRSRWTLIEDRICHSPCASGRHLTGWELEDDQDYYPRQYLNKLAHCGINGIWAAGLLRRLVPSRVLPELGPPTPRLAKLQRLVRLAGDYGIRVYWLGMEPRGVPNDHPVFTAHPHIKGARFCQVTSALCTSTPLVQDYIRDVVGTLFTEVPDLGGLINLYNGERGTTCWLGRDFVRTCPRCRQRSQGEVLAEDLNCFHEGLRTVSPTAKLLAWAYTMNTADSMTAGPTQPVVDTIARTHPDVVWLGNFEHGGQKTIANRTLHVHEYSLSCIGPSPAFRRIAQAARRQGARGYAKLQIGTSYEMSSLPYLPTPGIVYEKFAALRQNGIGGTMVNWLPGGYPSPMLKAVGEAAFSTSWASKRNFLESVAALSWGLRAAPRIARAWEVFSRVFQRYPCVNQVLYFSPITRSPAYHLELRRQPRLAAPYNWGINDRRQRQPFEDQVARWLGPFSAKEIIGVFRAMGRQWNTGLTLMRQCLPRRRNNLDPHRQYAVAAAARLQFLSMANVVDFYRRRDALATLTATKRKAALQRMQAIVRDDMALAQAMKRHAALDCFIGFHTEMSAYSYSPSLLDAKIRHSRGTLKLLDQWIRTGQRPPILDQPLPVPPDEPPAAAPTYKTWLQHGD